MLAAMRNRMVRFTTPALLAILAALLIGSGCEVDSSDGAARDVEVTIAGVYYPSDGDALVSRNTGAPIRWLRIDQAGDRLAAVDDSGRAYAGSISQVVEDDVWRVAIVLEGDVAGGVRATLTGTVIVSGSSAAIDGTWAEPSLFATVRGTATVPEAPEPGSDAHNGGDGDGGSNGGDGGNDGDGDGGNGGDGGGDDGGFNPPPLPI
jgi:hypothetical protein